LAVTDTDPTNPPSNKLWEIRSFAIGADGLLKQNTVAQTPALAFNGSAALAEWLNANAAAVRAGTDAVPAEWLDAASPMPFALAWTAPGVEDPAVLSQFAINTCSGCHRSETGTAFVHIGKRLPGAPPIVSEWLATVDLPRRVDDLRDLLE